MKNNVCLSYFGCVEYWAFAQQEYSPSTKENCTELKLTSCEMVVAARSLHGTGESTTLSLVLRNTKRLVGYNIPPTCWSDAGDLRVQQSYSACTRNVQPGEDYLFCLETVSGECPRLAPGIKSVPLARLMQTAYNANDGRHALLRRRRQEHLSTSKGLIFRDDFKIKYTMRVEHYKPEATLHALSYCLGIIYLS